MIAREGQRLIGGGGTVKVSNKGYTFSLAINLTSVRVKYGNQISYIENRF